MRLLFVIPYVPNPIRVRPYELLRTLATRGHEITLATLWQSEEERQDIAKLEALGIQVAAKPLPKSRSLWNSVTTLPTRTPLQARYCWQPALAKVLEELISTQTFDVAHVEHLRGAAYGLHVRRLAKLAGSPLPVVWDSVDCISHLFTQASQQSRSLSGRIMTTLELPRTRRYEGWLLQQFDQVLVTSKIDGQALCDLAEQQQKTNTAIHKYSGSANRGCEQKPIVLPNGVDLTYFMQREAGLNAIQPGPSVTNRSDAPTVVFSGKMSYHANVTAALYLVNEIMPHVWRHYPAVHVQIVGKDPPAQIRSLADTALGSVEVTGTVPDLPPYLQQATVAAAPLLYGAGIQNKVLEAMACGAPVITSQQAASGMQATPGRDLVVAADAVTFGQAIVRLIENPAERQALSAAGRRYVENHHSWLAVVNQLEAVYADAQSTSAKG